MKPTVIPSSDHFFSFFLYIGSPICWFYRIRRLHLCKRALTSLRLPLTATPPSTVRTKFYSSPCIFSTTTYPYTYQPFHKKSLGITFHRSHICKSVCHLTQTRIKRFPTIWRWQTFASGLLVRVAWIWRSSVYDGEAPILGLGERRVPFHYHYSQVHSGWQEYDIKLHLMVRLQPWSWWNVEYFIITLTLKSILTRSGSTC